MSGSTAVQPGVTLLLNGDPTGDVTPNYAGQIAFDQATGNAYVATGVTSADWRQTAAGGASPPAFVQSTDPGAVGAGAIWINTTAIAGTTDRPVLVRNAADTGWITSGLAHYDNSGVLRSFVTLSNGGMLVCVKNSSGVLIGEMYVLDGSAEINRRDGSGAVVSRFHLQSDGSSAWTAGICTIVTTSLAVPNIPATDPSIANYVWRNNGLLTVSGFFTPATLDPATATTSDIVNALIALGLAVAP